MELAEIKAMLTAVLEGQQLLAAKLDATNTRLENGLDQTNARLGSVEGKVDSLTTEVAAIKDQLQDVSLMVRFLADKFGGLEADVAVLKLKQKAQ